MGRFFILFIFILNCNALYSQVTTPFTITFRPMWDGRDLALNENYNLPRNDIISFESVRFYISGIQFQHQHKLIWEEKDSYHLIDVSEPTTLVVLCAPTENILFDEVTFLLGIDSLTNVSGAFSGDLDPISGMYWTWQNGYINTKIEGKWSQSLARNHDFQYHLGGYISPFQTTQKVIFKVKQQTEVIQLDLFHFFSQIKPSVGYNIMSPGREAAQLSTIWASAFSLQDP